MGLNIDRVVDLAISGAILTGTDITISFSRLSL